MFQTYEYMDMDILQLNSTNYMYASMFILLVIYSVSTLFIMHLVDVRNKQEEEQRQEEEEEEEEGDEEEEEEGDDEEGEETDDVISESWKDAICPCECQSACACECKCTCPCECPCECEDEENEYPHHQELTSCDCGERDYKPMTYSVFKSTYKRTRVDEDFKRSKSYRRNAKYN